MTTTDLIATAHEKEHPVAAVPRHALLAVLDRKFDALPTEKCTIEIFKDGEWLACEWNPRTPECQAGDGYLGTARTAVRPLQIGFHAWEQNDSEFRYFCLPTPCSASSKISDKPKN